MDIQETVVIIADRAPARGAPTDTSFPNSVGAGLAPALLKHATIGDIVGSFKSLTSNEWLKVVKSGNINTRQGANSGSAISTSISSAMMKN